MDKKTIPTIGEQLQAQRKKTGLTQVALFEKSRISTFTISGLESGRITEVSTHVIRQLSKALNQYKFEL
jgi:transcriptional regulator with XRE-family HTH domain